MGHQLLDLQEKFKKDYPIVFEHIDTKATGLSIGIDNWNAEGNTAEAFILEKELDDLEYEFNFLVKKLYKKQFFFVIWSCKKLKIKHKKNYGGIKKTFN